jgi:hypothetical protein
MALGTFEGNIWEGGTKATMGKVRASSRLKAN